MRIRRVVLLAATLGAWAACGPFETESTGVVGGAGGELCAAQVYVCEPDYEPGPCDPVLYRSVILCEGQLDLYGEVVSGVIILGGGCVVNNQVDATHVRWCCE